MICERRKINELLKSRGIRRKSRDFLLPLLEIPFAEYGEYLISCNIIVEPENKLVLIFENSDEEPLKMLLYKLQSNHMYLDSYFDDRNQEVVLLFTIDDVHNFNKFLQGKYSEFTDKYKSRLISKNFHDKTTNPTPSLVSMWDALYPTEKKRKEIAEKLEIDIKQITELISSPDLEHEIYRKINELKEFYDQTG